MLFKIKNISAAKAIIHAVLVCALSCPYSGVFAGQSDPQKVRTLLVDQKPVNCPNDIGKMITEGLRARLKRLPHLQLIPETEIKASGLDVSGCRDKKCAVKCAEQLDSEKTIMVSITRVSRAKHEQLGDEGEYKYIYEVKPYDLFIIKIDLLDKSHGSIVASLEEKAKKNEINARLDALAVRLSKYFKPVPPPEPPRITPWIGVSSSCTIPFGQFGRIIGAAGGITLDIGLKHLGAPNVYAKISGGYYFLSAKKGDVKSYQAGQLSALGGYSFMLPKGFSITPMLGAGCQLHVIKDFQYTLPRVLGRTIRSAYYDPLVTLRCEGAYNFISGLSVTLTPGYTVFFENGAAGHYLNIDIGMKYEFDVKISPEVIP